MQDLYKGANYLLKGFSLIHQKGIRRFAYIPMAINTLLFSFAIWLGINKFDQWINNLMPNWLPEWLLSALMWVIWPLFASMLILIIFFSFSIIANLLAAPFNGVLAEAVETKLLGGTVPNLSLKEIIKDTPVMLWNEIRKIIYLLLWMVPLFILSWIPVINIIAPVLWVAFSSWMLAIDYHDYPMGNHLLKFPQQRALLRQKRSLALGFGLATLGATMIPLVNFLVIPAAVAGATALYLENLKD
ncbi:MAG: sulfate transporter CysZ [Gammaproteobacteria bacterium]|nr:MAG: sulfate transporter CysZ [Gammaproteobacteria bacterium]